MKFNLLKQFFMLAGFALLLTSCDTDIIDPPGVSDPSASVSNTPSGEIAAGSSFTFNVVANPSTENALKAIEFTEDGDNIPFSRITIGGSAASANPIAFFGDDKNGINWSVTIESHTTAGVKAYGVLVTDDGNNTDSDQFDVTTGVSAPTISVAGAMDVELAPGSTLALTTTLGKETYDLASIAVYQDDNLITDLDRLAYKELATKFSANPFLLPADDKDGGEVIIYLKVQETADTSAYRMVVTDEEGNSSDYAFDVITFSTVEEIQGVLLNSAGPTGTGGLDLDTGMGTGSSDAAAEIRDQGINTDLPAATNWLQQISGVNGSEIKYLKPGEGGLSETFTYDDVVSSEAVAGLFDSGVAFSSASSDVVLKDDMFIVKNGDRTFLLLVKEVNVLVEGNGDNYVFDIKK